MSPLLYDGRINREATALVEEGYEVQVIGFGPEPSGVNWKFITVGGDANSNQRRIGPLWDVLRMFLLVPYRFFKRQKFKRLVTGLRSELDNAEIIHAHDLPALEAVGSVRGNQSLIYDSHEFWSERPIRGYGKKLERWRDILLERRLSSRADAVLTVSNSIAEQLVVKLGREVNVIRNTFPSAQFSLPDKASYLAYAGNISDGRDLVTVVQGARLAEFDLRFKGRVLTDILKLHDVNIEEAGTVEEAGEFLARGGIAVVSLEDSGDNHRFALPNKLFHAVSIGIPVVAAGLPEMGEVVNEYGLGRLYIPGSPESFSQAVEDVLLNYLDFREKVHDAREHLNWTVDRQKLIEVYLNTQDKVSVLES